MKIKYSHNIDDVAVAMVMPTMDEKQCINLHNALKCENNFKFHSFSYLAMSNMKLQNCH